MGQEVRGVPEAAALSEAADREEVGIGSFLARQRRLRGISLDDLAARTRIPLRSLERLEGGAFDRISDGFTRGFVRTVAAALGLDADDAVARLLAEPAAEDAGGAGSRRLQRVLALTGALVVAVAAAVLAAWGLQAILDSRRGAAEPELLYRRDAVRALAETVGRAEPSGSAEQPSSDEPAPQAGAAEQPSSDEPAPQAGAAEQARAQRAAGERSPVTPGAEGERSPVTPGVAGERSPVTPGAAGERSQ